MAKQTDSHSEHTMDEYSTELTTESHWARWMEPMTETPMETGLGLSKDSS